MADFYLLPIEHVGNSRGPRYLAWRYGAGLTGRWSLKDFGNDTPVGLVASEDIIVRPDVIALGGEWSIRQRNAIAGYLRMAGIEETNWITRAGNWREGLQRLAGMALAMQAGQDDPAIWLGREIYFGFAGLKALDVRAWAAEREARARQIIEPLMVKWKVRPQLSWLDLLRLCLRNPLAAPFMALPATDAFTASDSTALTDYSASWTYNNGTFAIYTNAVYSSGASSDDQYAHWNADSFNADQYSTGTAVAIGNAQYIGVSARCAASAHTGYCFLADSTDGSYLDKYVAGVASQLGSKSNAFAVNDVVRLEISGTTLTPLKNGSTTGTPGAQTDSGISSGSAGVAGAGASTTSRLDNWEGGNLATATAMPVFMNQYRQRR